MLIPAIIINAPTILHVLSVSPRNKADSRRTKIKPRLVKGYAKLISSFDMVAIQNIPERNVATHEEKIPGSKIIVKKSKNLSHKPSGI